MATHIQKQEIKRLENLVQRREAKAKDAKAKLAAARKRANAG